MILRDKGRITEMLILLSLLKGKQKLREVAKDVGITVQGVSEYMKALESKGYVENGKLTPEGMEFLYASLEEIGDFVHDAGKIIGKIRITEVIAGESIKKGEEVGLFMKDGYIYAFKRDSPSIGTAIMDAKPGEDLGVGNLRGIMNIDYGNIDVFVMPPISRGGSRVVDIEKIKELVENAEKIGVVGVVAYVVLSKLARIDFEFGAVHAAIDAYFRGVNTVLFVSHELLPYTLNILAGRDVEYTVRNLQDL